MRVTATEFYKRPSYFFDLVAGGVTIEITRHGKVVSKLEPPDDIVADIFEIKPLISGAEATASLDASLEAGQGFQFGAFTFGGIWQGMEPFEKLEQSLGVRLSITHWFMSFEHAWDPHLVKIASSKGRTPLLSWEPNHINLDDVISGEHDVYLRSWAKGAKAFRKPFYLRPFPEMNGDWTSWNGQPDKLKQAWRHIVELFSLEGASNVAWVWCPNATDEPRTTENKMEHYYPGDDVVDILAVDGYNWGTTRSWSTWQSFDQVFKIPYERLTAITDKPIWIAETASAEQGGNKATWIKEMFKSTAFPKLEAVLWFNQNKEADWRVNSSDDALASFNDGLDTFVLAGISEPIDIT